MADMDILYRDSEMVAISKPSGLAVHRGWAADDEFAMTLLRDSLGQWVYPVHRLDRGASGVLLFGLSSGAARELCQRFERHEVEKRYLALVRGAPPAQLSIDHALSPDTGGAAQPAVTDVRLLSQLGRYAWVEAKPKSGRLHQIRRHLKHISCPIIGDVKYGKGEHNRLFRERYALHRLALHAASLSLQSLSNEPLEIRAPLPAELARALQQLEGERGIEPH
ncbi:MAG TPA: pseudouridine synthase [Polyangiaceae bacterium]|nr:pseudouridine synthase [Polyangiaceae bacterium]